MRRRLFAVATAISLLFCLASVMLYVRSYTRTVAMVHFHRHQARWHIVVRRGLISVDNQPQLDWEQAQSQALRVAEVREFFAASAFQTRWMQRYSGWRFEEVPHPDAETRQLMDKLIIEHRHVVHLTSVVKPLKTGLSRHETELPLLIVLFAVLPGIYSWHWHSRRRVMACGLCPKCEYNLMANTSGICPECGTPVSKAPADKSPRPA